VQGVRFWYEDAILVYTARAGGPEGICTQVSTFQGKVNFARTVDISLPGKGNSNSNGTRPVHQIISMITWIRTSRLSTKNSLDFASLGTAYPPPPSPWEINHKLGLGTLRPTVGTTVG